MSFKKIRMGEEEIFEVVIKDSFGRRLDSWKVHKSDFIKVIRILNQKYNIGLTVKEKDRDRDLEWIP